MSASCSENDTAPTDPTLAEVLDHARSRLADCPRVSLGVWHQPRRILGISRAARVRPAGTAWHLGALLLTEDSLCATGEVVRAREPARRGYTAESQRARAAAAEAAYRGGYRVGHTVHLDWRILDLDALARGEDAPPVVVSGDGLDPREEGVPARLLRVQWGKGAMARAVTAYIDERVSLLCEPPPNSTSRAN